LVTRKWLKLGKMAALSGAGGLLTNYVVATFLSGIPALIAACLVAAGIFWGLEVVTGPKHVDDARWRWLTRWFTRFQEEKRNRLAAVLEKHLDYARDLVEAKFVGDRRFLEWSRDLRRDAMDVLSATGWAVFQRQLDADSATGAWELGDTPGIGRVKVTITNAEDGVSQVIHRIPISPDFDRFKLVVLSLPPLVALVPPEGFID
jgi:hypothetical protein